MSDDMNGGLPEGWAVAPLKDHVYLAGRIGWRGLKAEEYTQRGPLLLSVHSLNYGEDVSFQDAKHISRERFLESPEIMLEVGDVLLAKDGAGIGKLGIVASLPSEATVNSSMLLIRASETIVPKFLYYSLSGPAMQEIVKSRITGSATPHLFQKDIKTFQISLPPLAEQRRIVAKLEALLAPVQAARKRLARVPLILKRFRQAVLAAACSGRLTADWREENAFHDDTVRSQIESDLGRAMLPCDVDLLPFEIPASWQYVQSQDLCRPSSIITYGVLKPVWVDVGIPTVRVQDMKDGQITVKQVAMCCPERAERFAKTTLEAGDLLIAKDGATLGKTAFVPPELKGGNITQHVLRFPLSRRVDDVFVRYVIDSHHGQDWMKAETKGVALPGVNVGDFRRMPIPLPPISEQHEIVRRVDALFKLADAIERRVAAATARADKLTQAILAKAFRGELVPTEAELARAEGREYESATSLLEHIYGGCESTFASATRSGKRRKERSP